jgi:hypothetical protein
MTSKHEIWEEAQETLAFRLGPWTLAKWSFASISNRTNPLAVPSGPLKMPPIVQPTTYQQMRDDGTISRALSFDKNAIRYIPYRGKRYFIDLSSGSFDDYLNKFAAKTRNTLKRKTRRFAENAGGTIDLRYYQSSDDMMEFCRYAIAISRRSYQDKIGFGFPESEDFIAHLFEEAEKRQVCGFVLMLNNRPISYVFCRISASIITYTIPGYDPDFVKLSPGTVLIYKILEKLFEERRFKVFDFGGQAWDYKAFFATGSIDYLKVIWFPVTAKNLILVATHHLVQQAWRSAAWARNTCRNAGRRFSWNRSSTSSLYEEPNSVRR